jgi:hypothetical protein
MKKYGVVTEQEKTATERRCPLCNAKLRRNANVFICPTHGTSPFEKKTNPDLNGKSDK